ncbi:MAG TPA: nucleoside transporter C-terminal domain-containing protein [Caulobacteraceae bacterium]
MISAAGILFMVFVAWLFSADRWRVSWSLVFRGLLLQLVLAVVLFKTGWGRAALHGVDAGVDSLLKATGAGTAMVFGPMADPRQQGGVSFFVNVTGSIVFIAALTSGLFYLGILQRIVALLSVVMRVVLGTSGSESLAAAVNMFVGQDESALFIRPYLDGMTRSELTALMTVGMGTIASGVLVAYTGMLGAAGLAGAGGHLLTASVLSSPASLVMAKIMLPETQPSMTRGHAPLLAGTHSVNLLDAICHGASEGFKMALNVMAMLLAFVALLHLANMALGALGPHIGLKGATFQGLFGYAFRPFARLMGVPPADSAAISSLLGERMVLNEFVAYQDLATLIKNGQISPRAALIATYALCGFANFSSIAIQIGGIGSLVPDRRHDLARYGLRAMIGGTLATFASACMAGAMM